MVALCVAYILTITQVGGGSRLLLGCDQLVVDPHLFGGRLKSVVWQIVMKVLLLLLVSEDGPTLARLHGLSLDCVQLLGHLDLVVVKSCVVKPSLLTHSLPILCHWLSVADSDRLVTHCRYVFTHF